ncbi:MAG: thioredoxin family protein, partial [Bacteroidetes bacterium QH_6_63_17]
NLDIMDQYLTDGNRSIPKLAAFSEEGNERFTWGPRPEGAAQQFRTLTDQYDDKSELIGEFLEHYEDGGWREADAELAETIQSATETPVPTAEG